MKRRISEIILRNLEFSVVDLHLLLMTLQVSSDCFVSLEGSCSVTNDASDSYEATPVLKLKELIVKANMSTQALNALLIPLVVSKVTIQSCTLLNEGEENHTFNKHHEVIKSPLIVSSRRHRR